MIAEIPYPSCAGIYVALSKTHHAKITPQQLLAYTKTGSIALGSIPAEHGREYLLCLLVDHLNDVIESFNSISEDLEILPELATTIGCKPSKRLELLVRGFYGEAYRGQEVIFLVAGEMRRRSYIARSTLKELRRELRLVLREALELRHSLAHGKGGFIGKTFLMLRVMEIAATHVTSDDLPSGLMATVARNAYAEKAKGLASQGLLFRTAFATTVEILAGEHGPV